MIRYLLVATLFSFFCPAGNTQQDLRIGEWRSHLPQNQGWSVTQSPDKIIYGTPWSLIFIDKEELSATFKTKTDGLSDIGIATVAYDAFNDQLFIAYDNSNIDILKDDTVDNIPNIEANSTISGDRRISDIHFADEELAYIATGFGIVAFDTRTKNFGFTAFTGIPIVEITSSPSYVYAATADGVYRIAAGSTTKADFDTWELLEREAGLPTVYSASAISYHNGSTYIGTDNRVFVSQDEVTWTMLYQDDIGLDLTYLQSTEDRLISGWAGDDFKGEVRFFDGQGDFITSGGACANLTRGAIRDDSGRIWYAEGFNGIRMSSDYTDGCEITSYNGPYSQLVSDIVVREGQVLCASGGVSESFGFLFKREGMYRRNERLWTNLNEFEDDRLQGQDVLSVFRVAIHPSQPKLYGGSYWAGLLEYDTDLDEYMLYNKTNSSLRGSIGDPARERVTGLAFDEEENLWVSTYNAAEPLNVFTTDGQWRSFDVDAPGTLSDVVIDDFQYKWCPVFGNAGGVLVYDSGESIASNQDDQQRFINTTNSLLTTNLINTVVVDREGAVWVGTAEGPIVFDCGPDAFRDDCQGLRPQVIQDGIPELLLGDQDIRVIAVDGADNKWFGTRNGIFVQSPNGEQEVASFTVDNSPLFDNEITALAYDESSGEMYIGTNKGILSYRTATTVGERVHRDDRVYAFPNPVPPDYIGEVAITGLVDNALVKITDIDGKLVTELRATGGTAIWDTNNLQNGKITPGVYLVWSADTDTFDSPDSFVTKVMVLK